MYQNQVCPVSVQSVSRQCPATIQGTLSLGGIYETSFGRFIENIRNTSLALRHRPLGRPAVVGSLMFTNVFPINWGLVIICSFKGILC